MTIVVTGGAGFIGSNFVKGWFAQSDEPVINLDKLTYAGNTANLESIGSRPGYTFVRSDIADKALLRQLLAQHRPRALLNFAAETHVDRSIEGPAAFIETNICGTFNLLECARAYGSSLPEAEQRSFRFLHVSTDEVYGSLAPDDAPFRETNRYEPNSPYSASKAAADHLVRAYFHTYGLPVLTTNCSNNYGPYQFPEKLIPLLVHNAIAGKPLPIYGDGQNIRDWLYVADHCEAIRRVLDAGVPGETYNIGGCNEIRNIDVTHRVCAVLEELKPRSGGQPYCRQIQFIKDRPGHDRRYAIDASKIRRELGWSPRETFESGIHKTVAWLLQHEGWVREVTNGSFSSWVEKQYGT